MHAKLRSWCTFRRTGKAECKDLNATRLNPTLSLAGSMRCIAGWSLERRSSLDAAAARGVALTRSSSCIPQFLGDVVNGAAAGDRCR
jgi:hypothetical protein